jgi:hypothetical protein
MFHIRPVRFSTLVAVCSLAVTVGSFGAALVLLDALVLQPVRVEAPDRLVRLGGLADVPGYEWETWWGQADSLESVSQYATYDAVVDTSGGSQRVVSIALVSPSHFTVLRHRPRAGRLLLPSDGVASGPGAAVVSLAFANAQWRSVEAAIGSELRVEGLPYEVVGIVGAGAELPRAVEVWVPASDAVTGRSSPQRERLAWAGSSSGAIGRRAPGAALPVVQEQLDALLQRLNTEISPLLGGLRFGDMTRALPLSETLAREPRTAAVSFVVASLVGLLLASLACGLLVANQQWARQREWALRQVLGATPADIRRQVMLHAAQWGVGAALVGFVAMHGFLRLVEYVALSSGVFVPGADDLGWHYALVAAAAAALAAVIVAIVPSLVAVRGPLAPVLNDRRPVVLPGYRAWVIRSVVVGLQACLAFVILVGGTFATRELLQHLSFDRGHAPRLNASVVQLRMPAGQPDELVSRWEALWAAAGTVPDVTEVGLLTQLPVRPASGFVFLAGSLPPVQVARVFYRGPFNHLLGIKTQSGTVPLASVGEPAAVLSREAASAITGGSSVPSTIRFDGPGPVLSVVGIVDDVRFSEGAGSAERTAYLPLRVAPAVGAQVRRMALVFSCRANCTEATHESIVAAIGPYADALGPPTPLSTHYDAILRPAKARAALANVYAMVALLVVLAGVYTLSGAVVLGSAFEAGMRMALGAHRTDVVLRLLSRACTPAAFGVAAGAVIVLLATGTRLREGPVVVSAGDLSLAALMLITTSVTAALGPALVLVRRPLVSLLRREG